MSWIEKIFGKKETGEKSIRPGDNGRQLKKESEREKRFVLPGLEHLSFGRYSDNNKTVAKTRSWYLAEDLYKEKKYIEALSAFLDYLKDDAVNNVSVKKNGENTRFTIFQGTQKLHGKVKNEAISVHARLAIMETPGIAIMRRMLEMNYRLYYTHTSMDEKNTLCMVFMSDLKSTSPGKLYYGLRELAIKADRQDDLLISDFPELKPVDNEHTKPLPEEELEIKYRFFRRWIEETLNRASELNQDSFSGAIAYLYLTLIYRIDFLIQPEAGFLSKIEAINNIYWDKKDEITLVERNRKMKSAIEKLLDITKENFSKDLYHSISTFSIAPPPKEGKVRDHIYSANKEIRWYLENKYPDIALVINEYGLMYNQFIHSMPQIQTDLITIYMAVMHPEFFKALGMATSFYNPENKQLNRKEIEEAVSLALSRFQEKFKNMKWDNEAISYKDIGEFGQSFSEQIANLNLETKRELL